MRAMLAAVLLASCGPPPVSAPPPSDEPPAASSSAPPPSASTPVAVAPPPVPPPVASSAAPPAVPPGRRFEVRVEDHRVALDPDEPESPVAAACDLARLYRGTIGKTPVSIWLQPRDEGVAGEVHYDLPGPGIPIEGQRAGETITLRERGAGTFVGTCDPSTGRVTGTYTLSGKGKPFSLLARPKSWPPLHVVERTVSRGAGGAACRVSDTGLRLFAIPAGPRAAINHRLALGEYGERLASKRCNHAGGEGSTGQVFFAGDRVLTVVEALAGYFPGVGVARTWTGGRTFDLVSGREVPLARIVSDVTALRRLVASCVHDFEQALGKDPGVHVVEPRRVVDCDDPFGKRYLWGCGEEPSPKWALVDGGIAILGRGYLTIEAEAGAMGPVISWAALQREKALVAASPVARLWASVPPAEADAPICTSIWSLNRIWRWQER